MSDRKDAWGNAQFYYEKHQQAENKLKELQAEAEGWVEVKVADEAADAPSD